MPLCQALYQWLHQGHASMLLAGVQGHLEGSHDETCCVRC